MVELHLQAEHQVQIVAYNGPTDSFAKGLYEALDTSCKTGSLVRLKDTKFDLRLDRVDIYYCDSLDFLRGCNNDRTRIEIVGHLVNQPVPEPKKKVKLRRAPNGST